MNFEHTVVVCNDAAGSDNRIHDDEVARGLGFRGGLVPGVTVYGYMTLSLARAWGGAWLHGGRAELRLLKPAYHGDQLRISGHPVGDALVVEAFDADGTLLATVHGSRGERHPEGPWEREPADHNPPRQEIDWDSMVVDEPLAAIHTGWELGDNVAAMALLGDSLDLWSDGPTPLVHPLELARLTNRAFTNVWDMPSWMHVGTVFRHLRPIHCGDAVEVRTVPLEKWERKGHQFAKLYIAMLVDGQPAVEAEHTAIFRIAAR